MRPNYVYTSDMREQATPVSGHEIARESPMSGELQRLAHAIAEIEQMFTSVTERLYPVLIPTAPQAASKNQSEPPRTSQGLVADTIAGSSTRLLELRDQLVDILGRLVV